MNETSLSDLSTAELSAATAGITAGDPDTERLAGEIRRSIEAVNGASRRAVDEAKRLYADDLLPVAGKQRLLSELPANLLSATQAQLDQVELNLDLIEGAHLAAILKHDSGPYGRDDANRRAELSNFTMNLKQRDATAALVSLASNVRYSTYLSGPMGASLAARFGFDAGILRSAALRALAVDGNPEQVRRSKAFEGIAAMRRVIGLAKGGRDAAVEHVRRGPKPEPSSALMS